MLAKLPVFPLFGIDAPRTTETVGEILSTLSWRRLLFSSSASGTHKTHALAVPGLSIGITLLSVWQCRSKFVVVRTFATCAAGITRHNFAGVGALFFGGLRSLLGAHSVAPHFGQMLSSPQYVSARFVAIAGTILAEKTAPHDSLRRPNDAPLRLYRSTFPRPMQMRLDAQGAFGERAGVDLE